MDKIDKILARKFKSKMALHGITQKQFCVYNKFDYVTFCQVVNGHRKVRDSYLKAINEYMQSSGA